MTPSLHPLRDWSLLPDCASLSSSCVSCLFPWQMWRKKENKSATLQWAVSRRHVNNSQVSLIAPWLGMLRFMVKHLQLQRPQGSVAEPIPFLFRSKNQDIVKWKKISNIFQWYFPGKLYLPYLKHEASCFSTGPPIPPLHGHLSDTGCTCSSDTHLSFSLLCVPWSPCSLPLSFLGSCSGVSL